MTVHESGVYPRAEQGRLREVHIDSIGQRRVRDPARSGQLAGGVGEGVRATGRAPLPDAAPAPARQGGPLHRHADGSREVLLEVPRYDFGWQTTYKFKQPKALPAGFRLDVELWFENTAERAEANGFSNEKAVVWSGPTTDEMGLGFLSYVYLDEEPSPAEPTSTASSGR